MTKAGKARRLDALPLFGGLSTHELERTTRSVEEVGIPAGAVLAEEGVRQRELMIVADGAAEMLRDGRPVGVVGAGEHFGLAALLLNEPLDVTVVARTPVHAFVVESRTLSALASDVPAIRRRLAEWLASRIRMHNEVTPINR